MAGLSDSAIDLLEESTFGAGMSVCVGVWVPEPGLLSGGRTVPDVDDGEPESMSIDGGRTLLFFRHVDLPTAAISLGLTSPLGSLEGVPAMFPSSIGFGWASERSPITAISPRLASGEAPCDLGESVDQKAQVEPALGVGSGFCTTGGASSIFVSSGSCADGVVVFFCASSVEARGAGVVVQKPNHDVDGGASEVDLFASVSGGAVCAGGVFGLSFPSVVCVVSVGCVGVGAMT